MINWMQLLLQLVDAWLNRSIQDDRVVLFSFILFILWVVQKDQYANSLWVKVEGFSFIHFMTTANCIRIRL